MPEIPDPEQVPQQPEGLTAKLDIPDMPDVATPMPKDLNWENIADIWKAVEHARTTKDPQEWQTVTGAVFEALKSWRKKETKVNDNLQIYNLMRRHAMLKPEGSEERQDLLDKLQKLKETFPTSVQRSIERDDARIEAEKGQRSHLQQRADALAPGEKPIVGRWEDPSKKDIESKLKRMTAPRASVQLPSVKFIDGLIRQLEGIRQGDFESYHPDVKQRIRSFQLNREHAQNVLRQQLKVQYERLNGIKDPARRAPLERRLKETGEKLVRTQDEAEAKILSREADALIRRLEGAQTDAGKAKIQDTIEKLKAKVRTPEELRTEQLAYSDSLKYDALLWLVTVISHPIKATPAHVPGASRGPSPAARPVGQGPYVPPKPGELWQVPKIPLSAPKKSPKTLLGRARAEEDPMSQRPYGGASECRIFLSLIHEGKYSLAKKFIEHPFTLEEGSLVVLENISDIPELNGLKGRIRALSEERGESVIVDLFKNDVIVDSAIKVAFYEARPYLL